MPDKNQPDNTPIDYPNIQCRAIGLILETNQYPKWMLRELVGSASSDAELLDILQFLVRHWQARSV